ncbi:hypothetical protein GWI33_011115 [Rhynchophorus ferrugineus]|uniref:Uncharacterized protein n=1 Tax=Rhynchophorus ferrugineus TaxID=354439 RepID=A0A834IUJ4_RHYFE|nr:hypothetical protein GWI33_011115 [Rhynchophorus ferrugineus]
MFSIEVKCCAARSTGIVGVEIKKHKNECVKVEESNQLKSVSFEKMEKLCAEALNHICDRSEEVAETIELNLLHNGKSVVSVPFVQSSNMSQHFHKPGLKSRLLDKIKMLLEKVEDIRDGICVEYYL